MPAEGTLDGLVAVVTGAGGGMGQAIARRFAAAGASLVLGDLDVEGGQRAADEAQAVGARAVFIETDVSSAPAVETMVATAVSRFGKLDCAVNAAAVEFERGPLADCDDDDFDRMIAVNLRSVFLCMKHEIAAMLAGPGAGRIVNVASTNSYRPQPDQPAYTASKHGVLGLTRSAAIDYARRGIRINAICPGAIDTPMLRNAIARRRRDPDEVAGRLSPLGRFGRPEEIAEAALWLCSDASSFVVGHALAVDGGYLAT
jgi:NAD(P)-dependent dehydrogenase (short-subunit alcohol dehydrogenase family)